MIKKITLISCLLIAIGAGIFTYRETAQPEEYELIPPSRPETQPSTLETTPPRINKTPNQPFKPEPRTPSLVDIPYAKKPEGNLIEFKVVNGLAIAYGDVLLGKPEPDFQGDRGRFEAPTPQLWDKAEIPYMIQPNLPNPKRVEKALEYLRQHTPLRFVPYENQKDAILFDVGTEHCYSSLGRVGGIQSIKLSDECQTQEILHEILHSLGFIHEQSRPDRDRYIQVLWQNIEDKYQPQFAIVPDSFFEAERGSPFDYHSIMLYQPNSFAIQPNLTTLISTGNEPVLPVHEGLSETDIKRINHLYNLYE